MRLNRRQWLCAASAVLAGMAMPRLARPDTIAKPPPALTPAEIREDLAFLRAQWAPLDRSFDEAQRRRFDEAVAQAMAAADGMSTADLALEVMRAVAIPRNGHTVAMVGRLLGDLPVRAWWFADGLFIVRAHPQASHVLGARIEKLGTLTPEEALARLTPFVSGTDQRVLCLSAAYLTSPAVLRRIGAVAAAEEVSLAVRLRSGGSDLVRLGAPDAPDPGDGHDPVVSAWSVLMPDGRDMPGRWLHALDDLADRPPAYARPVDLSTRWIGRGNDVLYIRSNYIRSREKEPLDQRLLFGVIEGQVVPRRPRSVVVDLRFNNGGNFFDTLLFAQALPKLMPEGGRVFVLIGRGTFSAALVTAAMLKGAEPGKVRFVGEPMGDGGRFWAEIGTRTLPHSGITVVYSTRLEDYERGCAGLDSCYWPTAALGPRGISLAPDLRVETTFADYAAGRDAVLAAALAMPA
ncbi:peptidase S41 [Labrys wisconsinensis]|uniref:Peptidase S41 n=1 Tax=Labrys wisconsinensis TaxID=425677 RepID=A0ABU0JBJ3_9HYPH|nr:peptidase S41 [Labrys wisconsinensis]MDQ0471652.1 hypothetical protein [Labrys wisconsinensis]